MKRSKPIKLKKKNNESRQIKMGLIVIFTVLLAIGAFFVYNFLKKEPSNIFVIENPFVNTEEKKNYEIDFVWYDTSFPYVQKITLENKSDLLPASQDSDILITFNHQSLVQANKSQSNASDMILLYKINENYELINLSVINPDTTEAILKFNLFAEIPALSKDSNYYLYYGNMEAGNNVLGLVENIQNIISPPELIAEFSQEFQPPIYSTLSRKWLLKGTEYAKSDYILNINMEGTVSGTAFYEIPSLGIKGNMSKNSATSYHFELDSSTFEPGEYQIQSEVEINGQIQKSSISYFTVSYPLIVTLTVDFEGADVSEENQKAMDDFSEKYGVNYTQFFNPSIYAGEEIITKDRADDLTAWIIERRNKGDEIGLHLHMHYHMIEAMGLEVKTEPKWTTYVTNGHDVSMTAYTLDETMTMLTWSKDKFVENGLPIPTSFRGGGWYADEETLEALQASGFLIDSSGRNYYVWGDKGLVGHWNLTSTTFPYHPSFKDQNKPGNSIIWEFPNNGGFALYSSSNKVNEFKNNFDANLIKPVMNKTQVLTYLAHPHDASKDFTQLNTLYDYISLNTAENDKGPVVFMTLEEARIIYEWNL